MKKERLLLLLSTCGLALVVTFVVESIGYKFYDSSVLLLCFWMFPGGLVTELFGLQNGDSWVGLAVGWFAYLVVLLGAIFAKKRLLFYVFYTVLCFLLILNIAGCHQDVADFKNS